MDWRLYIQEEAGPLPDHTPLSTLLGIMQSRPGITPPDFEALKPSSLVNPVVRAYALHQRDLEYSRRVDYKRSPRRRGPHFPIPPHGHAFTT